MKDIFIRFSKNSIVTILFLIASCQPKNGNEYDFPSCEICLSCSDSLSRSLSINNDSDLLFFLDTSTYIYSTCLKDVTSFLYEKTGIEPSYKAGYGGYYYDDPELKKQDIENWRKALNISGD